MFHYYLWLCIFTMCGLYVLQLFAKVHKSTVHVWGVLRVSLQLLISPLLAQMHLAMGVFVDLVF